MFLYFSRFIPKKYCIFLFYINKRANLMKKSKLDMKN